ncbi:MAG: tRNA (adenosine(37)-N6)-threonylcarbamoyltransferase complex dimerization subunit type 1 TsaB [Myxococcales bacterium]|nr:tRNA (adenosine(37)-N6)-threonylcarbamoyltransferase complex dimerization subunit type 1 TsaB [Myxococcales bacterium]
MRAARAPRACHPLDPTVLILAFDTSTDTVAVALLRDGTPARQPIHLGPAPDGTPRAAESLVPLLTEMLREQRIGVADLDLVVVGTGPGSFVGLRAGLAVAKGLALGSRVPVVGVPSLAALCAAADRTEAESAIAVVDARRGELFVASYRTDEEPVAVLEPFAASAPAAARRCRLVLGNGPVVLVGNATSALIAELEPPSRVASPAILTPPPDALARLGAALFRARGPDDVGRLEPLYGRPPVG